MKNKILILLFVLGATLSSCIPDEVCREETKVVAGIGCKWVKTNDDGENVLQLVWDTVSMNGVGRDSVLYDKSLNQNVIYAPLRSDVNQTGMSIKWHGKTDTLWIQHQNEQHFISMACGCFIYHSIDSVWGCKHFIDTAYVVNTSVTNVKETNIIVELK